MLLSRKHEFHVSQYLITIFSYLFCFLISIYLFILRKGRRPKLKDIHKGTIPFFQTAKVTDFLQAKHPLEVWSAVNEVSCPFGFCHLYRKCFYLSFHDPWKLCILYAFLQIVFDEEKYSKHVNTTNDIKECCKDVKVLGKTEIK